MQMNKPFIVVTHNQEYRRNRLTCKSVGLEVEGSLVRDTQETPCCVFEQDMFSSA